MKKLFILVLILTWFSNAFAYDWTYMTRVSNNSGGTVKTFYLWLPANASGIRGVIMTAAGRITQLSGDSTIRKACRESEIGIMGCPNLDGNFAIADTQYINNALAAFASQSKFPELTNVPLASYGTSVGGIFAWEVAFAYPGRFFGIIEDNSVYTKVPGWAPSGANLHQVPLILSRGYNEPVGDKPWLSKDSVLRQRVSGAPANMILKAGNGHFSWTKWEADYLAMWIKKAAAAKIPGGEYARTERPVLLPVSEQSGWLTDTNFTSGVISIASYDSYAGNKALAFWHFDQEMAEMWIQMHQGQFSKTVQLGEFGNGTFNNCTNPWQNCTSLNLGDFTLLNPQAITNAGLPVRYGIYNGSFSLEGNNVALDPTLVDETSNGWVVAIQEGNDSHQGWEAAVKFNVTKKNSGQDQTISYTPVPDISDTSTAITLNYSSSSGLPVVARVKSGPVELVGNQLIVMPFAGDSGAIATAIIRYGQGGNSTFKTAPLRTDTFFVWKTSPLPTRVGNQRSKSGVSFFPNPGKNRLYWNGLLDVESIHISDVKGREVLDSIEWKKERSLDVSGLLPGVYYIRYRCKDKTGVSLWVKE